MRREPQLPADRGNTSMARVKTTRLALTCATFLVAACGSSEASKDGAGGGSAGDAGSTATGGASSGGTGQSGSAGKSEGGTGPDTGGADTGGTSTGGDAGTGGTGAATGGTDTGGTSSGGDAGTGGSGAGGAAGSGAGSGAGGAGGKGGGGVPTFMTRTLATDHVAEGADAGDIDGDGVLDLVAGPRWYKGPSYALGGTLMPNPPTFTRDQYSTFFLTFVDDVDGDGRPDVIAIGDAGGANGTGTPNAFVYHNPGPTNLTQAWTKTAINSELVANESPNYVSLLGGPKR